MQNVVSVFIVVMFINLDQVELHKQRTSVAMELYETEKNYVKDLNVIVNSYLKPLRQKNIIPATVIWKLFSEVEVINDINFMLLADLEQRMKDWKPSTVIGDLFLNRVRFPV
jgi:hypothetical protein